MSNEQEDKHIPEDDGFKALAKALRVSFNLLVIVLVVYSYCTVPVILGVDYYSYSE